MNWYDPNQRLFELELRKGEEYHKGVRLNIDLNEFEYILRA